jgi:hypothetical protein
VGLSEPPGPVPCDLCATSWISSDGMNEWFRNTQWWDDWSCGDIDACFEYSEKEFGVEQTNGILDYLVFIQSSLSNPNSVI